MTTQTTIPSRDLLLKALLVYASQRPGLDPRDYDAAGYRAESRSIQQDLKDARAMLLELKSSGASAETIAGAFGAYSGRLSWRAREGGVELEYTAGQYWPTEYRRAVCAVAAQALWDHYREAFAATRRPAESHGDAIRRQFRAMFGRGLASRWFA